MAKSFIIFAWALSPMEVMVLLGLGVLLFGRRLPTIGSAFRQLIYESRLPEMPDRLLLLHSIVLVAVFTGLAYLCQSMFGIRP